MSFKGLIAEWGEIPLRGISCPPGGSGQTIDIQPSVLRTFWLFLSEISSAFGLRHLAPPGRRGFKIRYETGAQVNLAPVSYLILRRERDSNSRYPFGVHTLSRRASSATRASLQGLCPKNRDCKDTNFFRLCKKRLGNRKNRLSTKMPEIAEKFVSSQVFNPDTSAVKKLIHESTVCL